MFKPLTLFALFAANQSAKAQTGIGVVANNACDTWQRATFGLVGGPSPVTLDIPPNQTSAQILCETPAACGYLDDWDTPKAHWLNGWIETQDWRYVNGTLTVSASGELAAYFVIDVC
jgi:hypothetical protein